MYFLNFSLIISSVDGLYPNPNFSLLLNIVARRPKSRVLYYQSLPRFWPFSSKIEVTLTEVFETGVGVLSSLKHCFENTLNNNYGSGENF